MRGALILVVIGFLGRIKSSIDVDRCTAIVTGGKAGADGPMTTHTADCGTCDFRIGKVPARDWEEGAQRPLYVYKGDYPSTITKDRGTTWLPSNLEGSPSQIASWGAESKITGYIPQVKHTYALFEAGYGVMNEHQLGIGESTCAARFWAAPTIAGGKAKIEARELSKLALERTKTAREAIALMGSLAEQYGFYAADWSGGDLSMGEGGEALTVVDKTEGWVFHVLGDDSGTSAVWVAQRVPDDHIAAVANQFVIRHVIAGSNDFMYSSNLWEVARRNGLWHDSDGPLDFLKTYAPPRAHSTYATRRVWRVFNLAAPSVFVPADTDLYGSDYPFSVKVDRPLFPADLMRIQRDHYEGSKFDLTKGLAAGPYGDPNRFDMAAQPDDNMTMVDIIQGTYERAISLFRTSYSIVVQARPATPDQLALLWFSQYAPSSANYAPLYLAAADVPAPYKRGTLFKYENTVPFWNFCAAGNYAGRFYKFAMTDVTALQQDLQLASIEAVHVLERRAKDTLLAAGSPVEGATAVAAALTAFSNEQADYIVASWKDLLGKLITKYHDGYRAENLDGSTVVMHKLFYPKWWLEATGYFDNKITAGPGVLMFAPSPLSGIGSTVLAAAITGCAALFVGVLVGQRMVKGGGGVGAPWHGPAARPYMPIAENL